MSEERTLSRRDFEAVMRRATELAMSEAESGELSEAELFRIAHEVGISDRHVRMALAQVRSGSGAERGGGTLDRIFGPEVVHASRVVPGTPREISQRIDHFMVAGRLLTSVRRGTSILQYRPSVDWISQVARLASATSRRYYVASAKSVEVHLDEIEPARTLVEFRVDPGTRGEAVAAGFAGGGAAGVGTGVLIAFGAATFAPAALAIAAGAVIGGGAVGGTVWGVGRSHQKKVRDVRAEVEGILDQLEVEGPLEPPPPSWQDWVRRQFHGARKLFDNVEHDSSSNETE
jgi:hypothetical protein